MRDTLKPKDYFLEKLQTESSRIEKFESSLNSIDPSNERGIRIGKGHLSNLYFNCVKLTYSAGLPLSDTYSYYLQCLRHYKDVCAPVDSTYTVIDLLSVGVLFDKNKSEFLPSIQDMVEKFDSSDGLVCCLADYLQDRPIVTVSSQIDYYNSLVQTDDKARILSVELSQWYQHHKDAHWYDSHKSKNNTYCGYWCFEIAALSKIYSVDDGSFAAAPYYPYDLAHYSERS